MGGHLRDGYPPKTLRDGSPSSSSVVGSHPLDSLVKVGSAPYPMNSSTAGAWAVSFMGSSVVRPVP
jgi:hypothetical protein